MNIVDTRTKPAGSGSSQIAGHKVINLALQGGGAHGAFTWGVLDRLLEEERLSFEGITASSAGAVNAAVLADGLEKGGREGARTALRAFWKKLSEVSVFKSTPREHGHSDYSLDRTPGFVMFEALAYFASPYQFNPLNHNPLKALLEETVDFERLRRQRTIKLFLCATDVRTAKAKVFNTDEIGADHVIASTCLPLMAHAVEIDGEFYWDGGYAGNPAIFPVIYGCDARDIVMVHITPAERQEVPKTSPAIMNRILEISFNTSIIREMRAVAFVTRLIDEGKASDIKRVFMHLIEAEDVVRELAPSSRFNGSWDFLTYLCEHGRVRADDWLKANFDQLGRASTVDLQQKYF